MLRTLVLVLVSVLLGCADGPLVVRGVVRDSGGTPRPGPADGGPSGGTVDDHLHRRHLLFEATGEGRLVVTAPGFRIDARWSATATEPLILVLRPARSEEVTVTAGRTEARLGDTAEGRSSSAGPTSPRAPPSPSTTRCGRCRGSACSGGRAAGSRPASQGASLRGVGPSGASRTLVLLDGVP